MRFVKDGIKLLQNSTSGLSNCSDTVDVLSLLSPTSYTCAFASRISMASVAFVLTGFPADVAVSVFGEEPFTFKISALLPTAETRNMEVVAQVLFANSGGEIESLISSSKFLSDCGMYDNDEGKVKAEKYFELILLEAVRTPITAVKNPCSLK